MNLRTSRKDTLGQAAIGALKPQSRSQGKSKSAAPSATVSSSSKKGAKRKQGQQDTNDSDTGLVLTPEERAKFEAWQKMTTGRKQSEKERQQARDAGEVVHL